MQWCNRIRQIIFCTTSSPLHSWTTPEGLKHRYVSSSLRPSFTILVLQVHPGISVLKRGSENVASNTWYLGHSARPYGLVPNCPPKRKFCVDPQTHSYHYAARTIQFWRKWEILVQMRNADFSTRSIPFRSALCYTCESRLNGLRYRNMLLSPKRAPVHNGVHETRRWWSDSWQCQWSLIPRRRHADLTLQCQWSLIPRRRHADSTLHWCDD